MGVELSSRREVLAYNYWTSIYLYREQRDGTFGVWISTYRRRGLLSSYQAGIENINRYGFQYWNTIFFGFRTSKPIVVRASYTEGDRIFNSQLDHRLGMRDRGERLIISCGPISEVRIIECCPEL